jgi:hypothetical protein
MSPPNAGAGFAPAEVDACPTLPSRASPWAPPTSRGRRGLVRGFALAEGRRASGVAARPERALQRQARVRHRPRGAARCLTAAKPPSPCAPCPRRERRSAHRVRGGRGDHLGLARPLRPLRPLRLQRRGGAHPHGARTPTAPRDRRVPEARAHALRRPRRAAAAGAAEPLGAGPQRPGRDHGPTLTSSRLRAAWYRPRGTHR